MATAEKITRAQVARMAQVSEPVVSWVINGKARDEKISEATIQRVEQAILSTGYRTNPRGRILKTGKSNMIGIISTDLSDTSAIVYLQQAGLHSMAHKLGIMVNEIPAAPDQASLIAVADSLSDAFILHNPTPELMEHCTDGTFRGRPYCVTGSCYSGLGEYSVDVDYFNAGVLAMNTLLEKPTARVGIIRNKAHFTCYEDLMNGCKSVLDAHSDIELLTYTRPADDVNLYDTGRQAVDAWIADDTLPDAIFTEKDVTAVGAINALMHHGIKCPEQTRVLGCDGSVVGAFSSPPLTTLQHPVAIISDEAIGMLLALVNGEEIQEPMVRIAPVLQSRGSL